MPSTGDLAHNPGMCPDWEWTSNFLLCSPELNPLSHPSQGWYCVIFKFNIYWILGCVIGQRSVPSCSLFTGISSSVCLIWVIFQCFLCSAFLWITCPNYSLISVGRLDCSASSIMTSRWNSLRAPRNKKSMMLWVSIIVPSSATCLPRSEGR